MRLYRLKKDFLYIVSPVFLLALASCGEPRSTTKIYNDTYFTSLDGKMLGINFNSTVEQYERNRSELQKTRDSIVIKPL